MSTITGSCTESAATALFEKGLEQKQAQQTLEDRNIEHQTGEKSANLTATNTSQSSEIYLGNKINVYA